MGSEMCIRDRPYSHPSSFEVILLGRVPSCIVQSLLRGCYGVLRKQSHLPLVACRQPVFRLPCTIFVVTERNKSSDSTRQSIELWPSARCRDDAGLGFQEALPCVLDPGTQRRDSSEASHYDPTHFMLAT